MLLNLAKKGKSNLGVGDCWSWRLLELESVGAGECWSGRLLWTIHVDVRSKDEGKMMGMEGAVTMAMR